MPVCPKISGMHTVSYHRQNINNSSIKHCLSKDWPGKGDMKVHEVIHAVCKKCSNSSPSLVIQISFGGNWCPWMFQIPSASKGMTWHIQINKDDQTSPQENQKTKLNHQRTGNLDPKWPQPLLTSKLFELKNMTKPTKNKNGLVHIKIYIYIIRIYTH